MQNSNAKHIGEMIRVVRKSAQMTQQDLANKLKISTQQVHKYEVGEDNISATKLADVANIFGCNMQIFFPKQEKKDFIFSKVAERKETFTSKKKTKNDDAILLLKYFFLCKKDDREKIFEFIKNIAKKNNDKKS